MYYVRSPAVARRASLIFDRPSGTLTCCLKMAELTGEKRPLGFDALAEGEDDEGEGYTVKFSSTDRESPEAVQEEINLIEQSRDKNGEDAEKVSYYVAKGSVP